MKLFREMELKSDKKKYQANAVRFNSNQFSQFGLVLGKHKNWSKNEASIEVILNLNRTTKGKKGNASFR